MTITAAPGGGGAGRRAAGGFEEVWRGTASSWPSRRRSTTRSGCGAGRRTIRRKSPACSREGIAAPAPEYARTKEHQAALRHEMMAVLAGVDALICPATTRGAPDAATTGDPAFNSPWSYTGLPVVSFPTGLRRRRAAAGGAADWGGVRGDAVVRDRPWCEANRDEEIGDPPLVGRQGERGRKSPVSAANKVSSRTPLAGVLLRGSILDGYRAGRGVVAGQPVLDQARQVGPRGAACCWRRAAAGSARAVGFIRVQWHFGSQWCSWW